MGGYEQEESSRGGQIRRCLIRFGRRVSVCRRSGVGRSASQLPESPRGARQALLRHDGASLLAAFRALLLSRSPARYLGSPTWAAALLGPDRFGYGLFGGQIAARVAFASAQYDSDRPLLALDACALTSDPERPMPTGVVVRTRALHRSRLRSRRAHRTPTRVTIATSSGGIPATAAHASSAKAFA